MGWNVLYIGKAPHHRYETGTWPDEFVSRLQATSGAQPFFSLGGWGVSPMIKPTDGPSKIDVAPKNIATTRWSLVLGGELPEAATSSIDVAVLCGRSMFPAYVWMRCEGLGPGRSYQAAHRFLRDLARSFANETSQKAPRNFRPFLADALAHRQRMAGLPHAPHAEEETAVIEARFIGEAQADLSTSDAFDRAYAGDLILRAHNRLTEEANQTRRERLFSSLDPYLAKEPSHAALEMLAFAHGMRPLLISLALERLRQRFRELADTEIAETVVDADELALERRTLLMILSRRH